MNLGNVRKSITWKLFIITTLVFTIFISSTLIIQSLFFGEFYVSKKKGDLQNGIIKFRAVYNKTLDTEKLADTIKDFEDSNNAKIVILDNTGKLKYLVRPGIEKYDAARVRVISEVLKEWTINSNILEEIRSNNKPLTIITEKKGNETRNIVSAVPNNTKNEVIMAVSSLQPVNEASSVIKEFYLYFYVGAVVLIIILSSFYSNMISKPLLRLNESASKIAKFDFTSKCTIRREDEIGNLANTLNFLSENLDKALTSLKDANAKLAQDIERERMLEKMRKEFVAAVSHELKTPITLIGGYSEALKDDIFQGEERDYYIDVIMDESKKMANLVADMLDLSQLESGNFSLTKEEFFIDNLIKTVLKKFSALINEKNIKLRMNLLTNIKVYADWNRMEQVITNFVTNAISHTDKGGYIEVNMKDKGKQVAVSIENTGKHIPVEEQLKIWDNFYKIDKSRNRKLGGTGLGLAIVKNILILHKCKYGVENTNNGVKFYFILDKI